MLVVALIGMAIAQQWHCCGMHAFQALSAVASELYRAMLLLGCMWQASKWRLACSSLWRHGCPKHISPEVLCLTASLSVTASRMSSKSSAGVPDTAADLRTLASYPDEEDGPKGGEALPQLLVPGGVQQHHRHLLGLHPPQLLQKGAERLLRPAHDDVPGQLVDVVRVLHANSPRAGHTADVCRRLHKEGSSSWQEHPQAYGNAGADRTLQSVDWLLWGLQSTLCLQHGTAKGLRIKHESCFAGACYGTCASCSATVREAGRGEPGVIAGTPLVLRDCCSALCSIAIIYGMHKDRLPQRPSMRQVKDVRCWQQQLCTAGIVASP